MTFIFLLAIVVATAAFLSMWLDRRAMARRRQSLIRRPVLETDTWYDQHYKSLGLDKDWSIQVAQTLAGALGCRSTQILASDSFDSSLAVTCWLTRKLDGDDEMNLFEEVALKDLVGDERYDAIMQSSHEIHTVADLVRTVQEGGVRS